jgi:hypothetical protein
MDAFRATFGHVDVARRLRELEASLKAWENPNQPMLKGLGEGLPKLLEQGSVEPIPPRARARAHNEQDLDLEQEQEQEQEHDGVSDSGSAEPPPATPTVSGPPPIELTSPEPTEKKKPGKKPSKRQKLPDDWRPKPEHEQLARQEGRDLKREATKFRNHSKAKRVLHADPDAAFSNWLMSDIGKGAGGGGSVRPVQAEDVTFEDNPDCKKAYDQNDTGRF